MSYEFKKVATENDINQLNSDLEKIPHPTTVAASTEDLNTYTMPTTLISVSGSPNNPSTSGTYYVTSYLMPYRNNGRYKLLMKAINIDSSKTYYRVYDSNGTWTDWQTDIFLLSDLPTGITRKYLADTYQSTLEILSGDTFDLNNYKASNYLYSSNAVLNNPNSSHAWLVRIEQVQRTGNAVVVWQTAIARDDISIYYRRKYEQKADTWSEWVRIEGQNRLANKKIAFMGDSIFAVAGNVGPTYNHQIPIEFANYCDGTIYNCAFGGTRMSVRSGTDAYKYFDFPSLVDAITTNIWTEQDIEASALGFDTQLATLKSVDFSTLDILIVNYGRNDYGADINLDNSSDFDDTSTMAGGMRYCIDKILTAYPNLNIIFNCPYYCWWFNSNGEFESDCFTRQNKIGNLLGDYSNKIIEVCNEYNIPYIENLKNFGWNKYNRGKYFIATDGTHFNGDGTAYCAKVIYEKLIEKGFSK